MFFKPIDISSFIKSRGKTFKLLDKFIERIGEQNIVQIIFNKETTILVINDFSFEYFN